MFCIDDELIIRYISFQASSILLDRDGQIRLGDYSLDKRLSDLFEAIDSERPGVHFKEENTRRTIGRGGKKGDIYRLVCMSTKIFMCIFIMSTFQFDLIQLYPAKLLVVATFK